MQTLDCQQLAQEWWHDPPGTRKEDCEKLDNQQKTSVALQKTGRCRDHRGRSHASRSMRCSAGRSPRRQPRSAGSRRAVPARSERVFSPTPRVRLCPFSPLPTWRRASHPSPTPLPRSPPAPRQEAALASVRCALHRPSGFSCP